MSRALVEKPARNCAEVGGDVRGVGQELGEGVVAGVVELPAGGLVEQRFPGAFGPVGVFVGGGEDVGLGVGQHAIKATQHRHRQHDLAVLVRPVRAAQRIVGNGEDQAGHVGDAAH